MTQAKQLRLERQDAFRVLHLAGWSMTAIARVLNVTDNTIGCWRQSSKLGINPTKYHRRIDEAAAMALYRDGASDNEIGRALGITQSSITRWRQRRGLERNCEPPQPLDAVVVRQARKLLADGASRKQVAEALDIGCLGTVQKVRKGMKKQGLRPTGLTNRAIRSQVLRDRSVMPRISEAVGRDLPIDVKHDAVSSLYLAVLDGWIRRDLIEERAPRFRSKAFALNGHDYCLRSMDDGEGRSCIDQIQDPDALARFDEISF